MFSTEKEMSVMFEKYLKANFGNAYCKESQGLFGVPDFVFYAKQKQAVLIISFELKLKNWKKAAKQAFRYKSFSNISYVVLSSKITNTALKLFEKYNIGLAKFDADRCFEILHKPKLGTPYSESLNKKLIETITSSRKKSKNIETLVR